MWIVNHFVTFPLILECCAQLLVSVSLNTIVLSCVVMSSKLKSSTILIDSAANKVRRVSAINYVDRK